MKQSRIKHLKKGAAGIVLLVCVICYSVGEHRSGRAGGISGFPDFRGAFGGAETFDLETDGISGDGFLAGIEPEGNAEKPAGEKVQGMPDETQLPLPRAEGRDAGAGKEAADTGEEAGLIYIHMCGAVTAPGVYELEAGSRVYQAVEAAGGLTDEAADEFLNMAQILSDGLQIYVPERGEAGELTAFMGAGGSVSPGGNPAAAVNSAGLSGDGRVNINTATKEELMALTGIGEARAEAILSYRREAGPFQTIEDIMKVSGIKEAAFQKIKEDITV